MATLSQDGRQMTIVWREAIPTLEPAGPKSCILEPVLPPACFRRLLDAMGQAVFAVDRSGAILVWNRAAERLFGRTGSAVLHRRIQEVLPPGGLLNTILRSLDHGVEFSGVEVETVCRKKPVNLLVDIRILRNQNRQSKGMLCVLTDLTDIREQERRLRHHERLMVTSKIIAGLAHEVHNPMAAIRGFAQLLLEGRAVQAPSAYLRLILEEADRVSNLIQGYISLGRGNGAGNTAVYPDRLVKEVAALLQGHCLLNGIDLQTDLRTAGTSIRGDPDQLKHVLVNLVKNALEATQPGGTVVIASRREDRTLYVEVRDNGHGIRPTIMPKIFDLYFSTHGGTGLGLPIARSIIHQHGGNLTIESIEGAGTTVRLTLPVPPAAKRRPAPHGRPDSGSAPR